jgi:hypothetical protein
MKGLILTSLALIIATSAMADDVKAITAEGACRLVAIHTPRDDVAHVGDADVPADLNTLSGHLGTVHIPITIDLAARFGIDVPLGAELEPEVAVISVQPDGRTFYNGQDLSRNIAPVCGQMHEADGQAPTDALGSTPTQ